MAEDMWDGRLEEGDFAIDQQFITFWRRVKYVVVSSTGLFLSTKNCTT